MQKINTAQSVPTVSEHITAVSYRSSQLIAKASFDTVNREIKQTIQPKEARTVTQSLSTLSIET
jgi:hypothetical protein